MSAADDFKAEQTKVLDSRCDGGPYGTRGTVDKIYEAGYIAGLEMARRLLRLQLGLAVPGDSE